MGFVVDKVSEDSFYENLLLGLSKVLDKSPCVSNQNLKRISGVKQVDIRAWEHNNGVILPEDLRSFYSSTNGFLFTYAFSTDFQASSEEERDFRLGIIQINPITDLVRIFGYETKNTAQISRVDKKRTLTLSRESKVYELAVVDENGKVVLVYLTTYSVPTVWFYSSTTMHFSYLAEDFTTYFRMCIAHLGIPCWQYNYSKEGLPDWTREMINIIAPGVLQDHNLIDSHSYKYHIEHINKIDSSIFAVPHQSCNNMPTTTVERIQSINKPAVDSRSKEKSSKTKTIPKRMASCRSAKKS